MNRSVPPPLILGTLVTVLALSNLVFAAQKPKEWDPTINPADFSVNVTNPYLPLVPGTTLRYEGAKKIDGEDMTFEVTNQTKLVTGVMTRVVIETHTTDGAVVEISDNYFAQDQQGNVWYFGEDSREIENGLTVSTEGSWLAGSGGAVPGIIMPASAQPGEAYFQEHAPGIAEDMAQVMDVGGAITVPAGTYTNVLRTKEWNPLGGGAVEFKYYAPNVGLIMEEGGGERLELVSTR